MSESQSIHHQPMTLEQYRRALESAKAEAEPIVRELARMIAMTPNPGGILHADGTFEMVETRLPPELQPIWKNLSDMRDMIYRKHGIEVRS